MIPKSPLSEQPPKWVRDLPATTILESLGQYYGESPNSDVCDVDYSLWECTETGLQFAQPMRQGNELFYEWVGSFSSYYPGLRWEFTKVLEVATQDNLFSDGRGLLLDVGSGRGDFLKSFTLLPASHKLGIDLNKDAVLDCVASGIACHHGTIESAIKSGFVKTGRFSIVTSFHCLEHVEDPVVFASSLIDLAARDGRVFVSTPNSPMSFEGRWFDILNHPPHHLTRWNPRAYEHLASHLGCEVRLFYAPASFARNVFKLFQLIRYGTSKVSRRCLLFSAAAHPLLFISCVAEQIAWCRQHPSPQSDVILVELRKR
jgi:2-polyprenyl-3-methyl-5-hydroxy-6-metoxy-1,4-benzoquinol methylase